jgi:carbonic anhydrase
MNFDYKSTSLKIAHHEHVEDIIDNGHTIQVTVEEGSTVVINDKTYHLKQFHFHSPSEHTVDDKHMPLEMHMVHQGDDDKLAVMALLFEEGASNKNLQELIEHMPTKPGENKHYADVKLDLTVHIPKKISAFHYSGSLTTPPCSEQVEWLVLRNKFHLSRDQVKAFATRLNNNNRPVQKLNGRVVGTVKIN